jgi:hypothetical protein
MDITKTEVEYEFEIKEKPSLLKGEWVGRGSIRFVDETLQFTFRMQRDGRSPQFYFEPGVPSDVGGRVRADLIKTLGGDYEDALQRAKDSFSDQLFDGGNGWVWA